MNGIIKSCYSGHKPSSQFLSSSSASGLLQANVKPENLLYVSPGARPAAATAAEEDPTLAFSRGDAVECVG